MGDAGKSSLPRTEDPDHPTGSRVAVPAPSSAFAPVPAPVFASASPRAFTSAPAPAYPHPPADPPAHGAQHSTQREAQGGNRADPRRIVVVGVCSSGKSTLVSRLCAQGYRAQVCAQEHSGVHNLWQASRPDVLVYLDAALPTIRQRRRAAWSQSMLDEEHRRLAHAREHCHLYIPTDGLSPDEVVQRVVAYLQEHPAQNKPAINDDSL